MRIESTIVQYADALERVDSTYRPLVERYIRIHEQGHRIYLTQQRQGFLPEDLTPDELAKLKTDPNLRSPYQLKRRGSNGQIVAVDYKEISPFRSQLPDMARLIEDTARFAVLERLPQSYLIEATLRPQAQAMRDGNFERAMLTRLNTYHSPDYESFFGLLDRYKDNDLNLHYSWQGWGFRRDRELTEITEQIVQHGHERASSYLSRPKTQAPRRVIAGDVLVFSGLAAESRWGGNTLPSEDRLRREIGSLSFLNINVLNRRYEDYLRNYVMEYVPELTQTRGWEERVKRAIFTNYALHEGVGHGLAMFDERSENWLKDKYTFLKELDAELLSFVATIRLPSELADISMKKAIIGASLAGWMKDIKENPNGTYGKTGKLLLNSLESHHAIEVNDENWKIKIGDPQHILEASRDMLIVLEHAIITEERHPGAIEGSVEGYFTYPRNYRSCDEAPSQTTQPIPV